MTRNIFFFDKLLQQAFDGIEASTDLSLKVELSGKIIGVNSFCN